MADQLDCDDGVDQSYHRAAVIPVSQSVHKRNVYCIVTHSSVDNRDRNFLLILMLQNVRIVKGKTPIKFNLLFREFFAPLTHDYEIGAENVSTVILIFSEICNFNRRNGLSE